MPVFDMTDDPSSHPRIPAPDEPAAGDARGVGAGGAFDPSADPLADPAFAASVYRKLLAAADHPWELDQPPKWDPLEAAERFLKLIQDVNAIVGEPCEAEMWPAIKAATFHGELVLPPAALLGAGAFAVVRASNFADLVAVLNDESVVRPEVLAQLRRRFERRGYRYVPSVLLPRAYDGHHRGTRQFATWRDRLFGYL